jgi:hypothetical protein
LVALEINAGAARKLSLGGIHHVARIGHLEIEYRLAHTTAVGGRVGEARIVTLGSDRSVARTAILGDK